MELLHLTAMVYCTTMRSDERERERQGSWNTTHCLDSVESVSGLLQPVITSAFPAALINLDIKLITQINHGLTGLNWCCVASARSTQG